ncbi:MAG: shikimate dehydrogenase [Acidobacteriota bacterium]
MSEAMICVSVYAETADELSQRAKAAAASADVVEIRFDSVRPNELTPALDAISPLTSSLKILATLRPKDQGGARKLSMDERREFWRSAVSKGFWADDLEEDIFDEFSHVTGSKTIASFHDFSADEPDLDNVYGRLNATADMVKIAVTAGDATDSIAVWKLLDRAAADGRSLVPIAMGEGGKWTRILGSAHGTPLVYASAEEGRLTAAGQFTADDLKHVFRIKDLSRATDIYGLIAGNTAYSMSPYIQNAAFSASGIDAVFVPFQTANIEGFVRHFVRPDTRQVELNLKGFAVTNPHKIAAAALVDELDDAARQIGSINTIKIEGSRLIGKNTDADGFIGPLEDRIGSVARLHVAVVGSGGAARACAYALKRAGADVTIISRNERRAAELAEHFTASFRSDLQAIAHETFDIIVNATPLGTLGTHENETVASAADIDGARLVYDLVYNPVETLLMREARLAGVETLGGMEMLIAQGAAQFEIWTGLEAPAEAMRTAAERRLQIVWMFPKH